MVILLKSFADIRSNQIFNNTDDTIIKDVLVLSLKLLAAFDMTPALRDRLSMLHIRDTTSASFFNTTFLFHVVQSGLH